ncbi:MAG: beta-lactamase family protein [Clostridia bacterium]|nr:beta-lactamase family protein [Clostridia bacterium]
MSIEKNEVLTTPCKNAAIGGEFWELFPVTVKGLTDAVGSEYSGFAAAVLKGDRVLLKVRGGNSRDYSGTVYMNPDPKPLTDGTLFDLASLSKLVSTSMTALKLFEGGILSPADTVGRFFDNAGAYRDVSLTGLMTHTSGLTPHIALYKKCSSPDEAVPTILASEPLSAPGTRVHYSCMGYILLKAILEKATGKTLDVMARDFVFRPLGMKNTCYNPSSADVAATEYSPYENRYIIGSVHDENARFLGGVSGNAGVFSTLDDMISFGSMLSMRGKTKDGCYLSPRTFSEAVRDRTRGLGESRGLGFSLRDENLLSAMGEFMSHGSYGHNGFTGTSLYCDAETGITMILLTNAVHYGRDGRGPFFRHRRIFHNTALTEALKASGHV